MYELLFYLYIFAKIQTHQEHLINTAKQLLKYIDTQNELPHLIKIPHQLKLQQIKEEQILSALYNPGNNIYYPLVRLFEVISISIEENNVYTQMKSFIQTLNYESINPFTNQLILQIVLD